MDLTRERQGAAALRAYVSGESSEPVVLSAFRGVSRDDLSSLVDRHRDALAGIDRARLVILESMLLPFDRCHG